MSQTERNKEETTGVHASGCGRATDNVRDTGGSGISGIVIVRYVLPSSTIIFLQ